MSTIGLARSESDRLNGLLKVADIAGLAAAGSDMAAALDAYEAAVEAKRVAKAEVELAQQERDDAADMAREFIGRKVTKESTKSFVPDTEGPDGRRQVTADEAKAWVERTVAREADVVVTNEPLAEAKARLEEAQDRIAVAERRFSATKHASNRAVALTELLATGITQGDQL